MTEVYHGRGYVYSIEYHIVWCVKYRKPILKGNIEVYLKEILLNIAEEHNFKIEEMETDKDHIHILISCKSQHYIPDMVKALKGVSARKIFSKFPWIKQSLWDGHLWNPSYFVATVSENTEEQIRKYIQNQKIK